MVDAGGYIDTPNCPPQLLTFDLRTSQLLNRMEIPKHIVTNSTIMKGILTGIAVKTSELDCAYFTVSTVLACERYQHYIVVIVTY